MFDNIGRAFALLREDRNVSVEALGQACGVTIDKLHRFEAGCEVLDLEVLGRLLDFLGLQPAALFGLAGALPAHTGERKQARYRRQDQVLTVRVHAASADLSVAFDVRPGVVHCGMKRSRSPRPPA
jgi:hypothetical protein